MGVLIFIVFAVVCLYLAAYEDISDEIKYSKFPSIIKEVLSGVLILFLIIAVLIYIFIGLSAF